MTSVSFPVDANGQHHKQKEKKTTFGTKDHVLYVKILHIQIQKNHEVKIHLQQLETAFKQQDAERKWVMCDNIVRGTQGWLQAQRRHSSYQTTCYEATKPK